MTRNLILALTLLLSMLFAGIGCSGGGNSAIAPPLGDLKSQNTQTAGLGGIPQLWGLWQVDIDTATGQVEIIPLRGASFTANVNQLLESKPGNLIIGNLDLTKYMTEGKIDCTVTLKHPFPGLYQYDGFDVWGVFMHNGASEVGYDGLRYSGGPNAGTDEGSLLNPDGYTRWFNKPEFDGSSIPIMQFWPGKLANFKDPTATLNAYKVFADGLGTDDSYYDWITSGSNAADRGIFRAGASNTRRYLLQFPMSGGAPVLTFQYAVIATWEPGDPATTGNPATYEPGDFPTSANVEEPFLLNVTTIQSDLYNDGAGDAGGNFKADVEVFDWQGGSVGHNGVPNEVNKIIVIGNFVPGGKHEFTQADLASVAMPSTENSSVFQVEIPSCTPVASGQADLWIVVEAGGLNGASFYQGFPTPYPPSARRASFLPGTVAVAIGVSWPDVVYVDDSNTTGVEDGTHQHPWNTIQEGIDNNPDNKEVWVDDSGTTYAENVKVKNNSFVKSTNWDTSDGVGRAKIEGPIETNSHSVEFNAVQDATIQGFEIAPFTFDQPVDYMDIVLVTGGSNNTIKDCLFKGAVKDTVDNYVWEIRAVTATNSTNLAIQNCRIDGLDRGVCEWSMGSWAIINATTCPNLNIKNNVFTNLRPTGDATGSNGYITYLNACNDATIKNNIIHHIKPISNIGGSGANLHEGFRLNSCTNAILINNTVDSFDVTAAFFIQQVFAYRFENCIGLTFKNDMATSIYSNGFPPPLARGVLAVNTTFTAYCCDMWDIGPGSNGQNYYTSGGVITIDPTCISQNPQYINKDTEQYDLQTGSPAQKGDPTIVDWDDTGTPSGDPSNPDTNKRSRMGCYGGPDGQYVGLLTP